MPNVGGLEVLLAAKELDRSLPVILMTAQASLQTAMRAVNEGAFYYIQKPFSNDELVAICRRAAESRQLKKENQALKTEIRRRDRGDFTRPIGRSRRFTDVLKTAETVAPSDSTVLITGESGTGKEVLAKFIHTVSDRGEGPFVSINCGALPENLLESELFGHVRGSFTGAVRDKQGLFVAANGGSFFLDEVGEMSAATQVKLLRVLQERVVHRVGGGAPVPVDYRLVAAANVELEDEVAAGRFREDLFYRLNVFPLTVPPLRERGSDIGLLAHHFRLRAARENGIEPPDIPPETIRRMMEYTWPGNVRELENFVERAVILHAGAATLPFDPPRRGAEVGESSLLAEAAAARWSLERLEREYVLRILREAGGNQGRAAEMLGIDRRTLTRKLKQYREEGTASG